MDEVAWRIDAWDSLAGRAFLCRRPADQQTVPELDQSTVFVSPPFFSRNRSRPVRRALRRAAARSKPGCSSTGKRSPSVLSLMRSSSSGAGIPPGANFRIRPRRSLLPVRSKAKAAAEQPHSLARATIGNRRPRAGQCNLHSRCAIR